MEPDDSSLASVLRTRLDRLIAFLDSHFGTVELLLPQDLEHESNQASISELTLSETQDVEMDEESIEEGGVKEEDGEGEGKIEEGEKVRIEKRVIDRDEMSKIGFEKSMDNLRGKLPTIRVWLDSHSADVSLENLSVVSSSEALLRRVQSVVDLAIQIITPLDVSRLDSAGSGPFQVTGAKRSAATSRVRKVDGDGNVKKRLAVEKEGSEQPEDRE